MTIDVCTEQPGSTKLYGTDCAAGPHHTAWRLLVVCIAPLKTVPHGSCVFLLFRFVRL